MRVILLRQVRNLHRSLDLSLGVSQEGGGPVHVDHPLVEEDELTLAITDCCITITLGHLLDGSSACGGGGEEWWWCVVRMWW